MDEAQETLAPGITIDGKYRVVRLIGRGGMGAVYQATVERSGVKVAVKVLDARYCQVPEVVKRFHREARLAAAIGHDNICEVVDVGTHEGSTPYLVMPLLKGQPLGEILKSNASSLTETRITRIVFQILSALAAAHEAGVVHRDLKPDNIFITSKDGDGDFVKLLDFGVSKMVASTSDSIYTKQGTVIGTPAYMAPEQARGVKSIDHRIDLYAMGVILYEIMAGRRPYRGDSPKEIIFKIIGEPFLSPRRVNQEISEAMENVIIKAMAKDPHQRYASAVDLRDAFGRAAGVRSIPRARETSAPTLATMAGDGSSEPAETAPKTRPAPKTMSRWMVIGLLVLVAVALIVWLLVFFRQETPVVVPLSSPVPSDGL